MSYLRGMMVAVLLTTLLMVGCGGGGGGTQQDWVVGTWRLAAVSSSLAGERDYDLAADGVSGTVTFGAGGTFSIHLSVGHETVTGPGRWVKNGSDYVVTFSDGQTTYHRRGDELYWVYNADYYGLTWWWYGRS